MKKNKNIKIILPTGYINISIPKITMKLESGYLITSNKEKCRGLIEESPLNDNDIIDILVSLHLVLEVGLNTMYRHLMLRDIKKDIDKFEIMKNIDNINFIDKTIMFIYNSKFDFEGKLGEATRYHSIINALRDFSGVRNKLLHGHSISTISDGEKIKNSEVKNMLNPGFLKEQIGKFCFIMEGMRFYLNCLDSGTSDADKEQFSKSYLDDSFLPLLRT